MMTEPITSPTPTVDATSGASEVVGLSNQGPGSLEASIMPNFGPVFEEEIMQPQFLMKIPIDTNSRYISWWKAFYNHLSNQAFLPFRMMPLLCYRFFNFAITYTFVAIAHERARCKFKFNLYPGWQHVTEENTIMDTTNIFDTVSQSITPKQSDEFRGQRDIWDIETSKTYSLTIYPTQNLPWWHYNVGDGVVSRPNDMGITYENDIVTGIVAMQVEQAYEPGNLCPDTFDVIVESHIHPIAPNCSMYEEYQPPYGALDYMTNVFTDKYAL